MVMQTRKSLDHTKHKSIHLNSLRVKKQILGGLETIFSMPQWPPWFIGLDVLIMVKAGM
jgi:hypothetical protein